MITLRSPRQVSVFKNLRQVLRCTVLVAVSILFGVQVTHAIDVGPLQIQLVDGSQTELPTYHHQGTYYVKGERQQRYMIRVSNTGSRRLEVVLTVDGRDVVNGQPGAYRHRGYVVDSYQTIYVEGFRRSASEVATFRFTTPADSYAGRVGAGENVGVIGVAVFREKTHRFSLPTSPRDDYPSPSRSSGMSDYTERGSSSLSDASSRRQRKRARPSTRSEIGTRYGERRHSEVEETSFERDSTRPYRQRVIHYDSAQGLRRRGIMIDRPVTHVRAFPDEQQYAPPPPGHR